MHSKQPFSPPNIFASNLLALCCKSYTSNISICLHGGYLHTGAYGTWGPTVIFPCPTFSLFQTAGCCWVEPVLGWVTGTYLGPLFAQQASLGCCRDPDMPGEPAQTFPTAPAQIRRIYLQYFSLVFNFQSPQSCEALSLSLFFAIFLRVLWISFERLTKWSRFSAAWENFSWSSQFWVILSLGHFFSGPERWMAWCCYLQPFVLLQSLLSKKTFASSFSLLSGYMMHLYLRKSEPPLMWGCF